MRNDIHVQPSGIITLTTDFGLEDGYVGTMHGVIYGIAPHARIIDYSHAIPPQNLHAAAYVLSNGYRFFPPGTVHVVVVDPGVGSARRAVAIAIDRAMFVGPDNGVLAAIVQAALSTGVFHRIVELRNPQWWLPSISATFHGRDIFAPVAAHLSNGVPLEALGPTLAHLLPLKQVVPTATSKGIEGEVVYIDHFGNCITNIDATLCAAVGPSLQVVVGQVIAPLVATYSEVGSGQVCGVIGSAQRLEIAVRDGNAASQFGLGTGFQVQVVGRRGKT